MHSPAALSSPPTFPKGRALLLAAALAAGAAGVALNGYLGRGPGPATVTSTSGAATFNFRVTGIPVPGKIEGVTPQLTFDPRHLERASGLLAVDLAKLDTGIKLRDTHAKEFLGVSAHPTAVFALAKLVGAHAIRPGQTLNATAVGTLDLNGVTVPLKAPVTLRFARGGATIDATTAFNVSFKAHHISIPGADPQTDVKVAFRLPVRR